MFIRLKTITKETKKSEIIVKNINYAKGLALKIHKLNGLQFLNNQQKTQMHEKIPTRE